MLLISLFFIKIEESLRKMSFYDIHIFKFSALFVKQMETRIFYWI